MVSQCLRKVICWFVAMTSSSCSLYSCLANGSADEFQRGDQLFRMRAVKDPLQIGKVPSCLVLTLFFSSLIFAVGHGCMCL